MIKGRDVQYEQDGAGDLAEELGGGLGGVGSRLCEGGAPALHRTAMHRAGLTGPGGTPSSLALTGSNLPGTAGSSHK